MRDTKAEKFTRLGIKGEDGIKIGSG